MNPVLLLWLEGPLQSWGVNSLFNRRATLEFPTRSGVLGLALAALGAGGDQEELLSLLAPYPQTVIAYARKGADPALQLRDFHMVGNGYDEKDPWELQHIPKTSEGKKPVGSGAKLTYRHYVQEMAFAVLFHTPESIAASLIQALQYPVWDTALGRRCCVPVEYVYQGRYETEEDAETRAREIAGEKRRTEMFRVGEVPDDHAESLVLADIPLRFGKHKQYLERRVYIRRTARSDAHGKDPRDTPAYFRETGDPAAGKG